MNIEQKELVLNHIDFVKRLSAKISARMNLSPSQREECESIALMELCECAVNKKDEDTFRSYVAKTVRYNIWQYLKVDFCRGIRPPSSVPNNYFNDYKVILKKDFEEEKDDKDIIKSTENMIDFQSSLSPQEVEVYNYIMLGLNTSQISQKMGVSKQWVYVLKSTIKDKLMAIMAN